MSSAARWRCTKHLRVFNFSRGAWDRCRAGKEIVALAARLLHSKVTSSEGIQCS